MVTHFEQHLLDQLEDARDNVKYDKQTITLLVTTVLTSGAFTIGFPIFLSVLHSWGEDWGDASGWPAVFTLALFIASTLFLAFYFIELRDDPTPREALRKLEREYRDHLNRKADKE